MAAGAAVGIATVALVSGALLIGAVHLPDHASAWSDRLSLSSPSRSEEGRAALRLVSHHLLTGVGPGRAVFLWSTADRHLQTDRYAHDEYLQLAVEQGVIGELLLLVLLVAVVGNARAGRPPGGRRHGDRPGDQRLQWVAAVVGLALVAAQSGLDFLWHIPAVPLVAAVLVGLSGPPGPNRSVLNPNNHNRLETV